MTDPALRIACAEECGWKGPHHPLTLSKMEGWWSQNRGFWWLKPDGETLTSISDVPDYPNDLNSCAQFEATLKSLGQECEYIDELEQLIRRPENIAFGDDPEKKFPLNHFGRFAVATASARQRCEVFLKVKGRWQPGGGEGAR